MSDECFVIYDNWVISRLRDCESIDESFIGIPGYRDDMDGFTIELAAEYSDLLIDPYTVGIVFHSLKCARHAVNYLNSRGISPKTYHCASDDERTQIKRDIIENLPW